MDIKFYKTKRYMTSERSRLASWPGRLKAVMSLNINFETVSFTYGLFSTIPLCRLHHPLNALAPLKHHGQRAKKNHAVAWSLRSYFRGGIHL